MGDTSDGSSGAAQSAQQVTHARASGFLGRVFAAFSSQQEDLQDEPEQGDDAEGPERPATIGLGNLRSKRVEDVMIPKVEITSVPSDIDQNDLVHVFRDSGLTRLPVYDGTLDHPLGMIHLKDMALRHGFNADASPFELLPMLRPLIYAPPSMPIGVLLQKMQTERRHMALVIDEYGGVDGLVTIEDLIEQVIGEIEDEHDQDEGAMFSKEKSGCYMALARTPLDEFESEIGVQLADPEEQEEIETLGGLVFMLTGRVPARGEVVPHDSGIEFEVIDADPRRIKRLRVRMPNATRGVTIVPTSAPAAAQALDRAAE